MASLVDPLNIRGYSIRNRIVMPPMFLNHATQKGEASEKLISHYLARNRCTGMIIVEHTYISVEGQLQAKQLGIHNDALIDGLSKLASAIKKNGCIAAIQLTHAGGRANPKVSGIKPVCPSAVLAPRGFEESIELTKEHMKAIAEDFVKAASRALRAGFDGVELHGCHGYLLNHFLAPLTNRRTDEYGGSLENRLRFPLEIVRAVRSLSNEMLLLYRLAADDLVPGGMPIDEGRKVAVRLEEEGVDIIDVSAGIKGGRPADLHRNQGYYIPLAEQIKKVVKAPVIGVGGCGRDPLYADQIVREQKVDLVAVGRPMLKNADWACDALNIIGSA